MEQMRELIVQVVRELYGLDAPVVLTRPEPQFGDFATNVALQLAKQVGKNPREIAEAICAKLTEQAVEVSVAGPGFINITLSDAALLELIKSEPTKSLQGKTVVAEYSDPNPFKVLHAGHLYTSVVGDAIANLLQNAGAEVHRVNFGGDVGLHVGKTMWAILRNESHATDIDSKAEDALRGIEARSQESLHTRAVYMGQVYAQGTEAYETNEETKQEIIEINKRIYLVHAENDHTSALAQIYWTCRDWSYEYFDQFYDRIGTKFEKYYPESGVAELGLKTVREQQANGVFVESDGAVVFKGEDYGLHTRVFINREGIPTYEAKDVGLIMAKKADYNFDKSVVITGNEQEQYMAVVLKAVEQFAPELTAATTHLTHGIVKLQGGVKMSSRKGNILRAVDVLDAAAEANQAATGKDDQNVVLGAVKYAFLKQRTGGDIIYDPKESVSLEGNSGPYLQYAHARARSIMRKVDAGGVLNGELQPGERSLGRKIGEYAEVVNQATTELMPHHIANYLYELAQEFNRFYEHNRVIGEERESLRLGLVKAYADTLQKGLGLLGIHAPDKM